MKLIQHTNRNFIVAALLVMPLASLFLFFSLNYFLKSEIDEQLRLDETRIVQQLTKEATEFSIAPIIVIEKLENSIADRTTITNVEIFDPLEKENEPFRELHSVKTIDGQQYDIKVRHSIIENEDVLLVIGITILLLLLLVILGLYWLNSRSSKKAWKPFYQNLETIKRFSLENKKKPVFVDSKIDEFQDLKSSLTDLTHKIKTDYDALKEFTENASHEIQTPLTIISMNLEEMLQEDLSEANYAKLYKVLQSTQKLSKLNEKLLLLSKLENQQFQQMEKVNFSELVRIKINELQPILEANSTEVQLVVKNAFIASMDPFLFNLLITNLLSNAIKHNNGRKIIQVSSDFDEISFQNSTDLQPNLANIFYRFQKQTTDENSVGLGLSIVKKIIDLSNMKIEALFMDELFTLRIKK